MTAKLIFGKLRRLVRYLSPQTRGNRAPWAFRLFRHRGDDAFFPHTVLKNGWVVLEVNGGVEG